MARFYVNIELACNDHISLPDEVVRHLQVLRMQNGDEISLFNGDGNSYIAVINEIRRKNVSVTITNYCPSYKTNGSQIELGLCLIANDKMDLAIQKATELGVTIITPITSERSQRLGQDKIEKRLEHWRKIIINSCEQCGQNIIPQINAPQKLNNIIVNAAHELKLILSPHHANEKTNSASSQTTLLLVGPEGGFSSSEVELALKNNFMALKLGNLVLRAETAVITGLSYINFKYGTWK